MVFSKVHSLIIRIYDSVFQKDTGIFLIMLFYSGDPFVFSFSMLV